MRSGRHRHRAGQDRRALLIDAMGTLVTLEAPAPRLRAELQARFGIGVSEAEAAAALRAEIAFYRRHMGDGRNAASLRELRPRCARVLRESLPAASPARSLDDEDALRALLASLRFRAFDDARGALVAARERGDRIIVVSNWDVSVLEVLEGTGLAPLLHGAVCSAAVGVAKPGRAIFTHALALGGVPAGAARHVGDSVA